jgi:sugar phosphate isomerase/epimerase
LKDVFQVGERRFESCRYGRGIVPLERCVYLLLESGYQGGFSIEHEPHNFDPREDVQASFKMLKGWMNRI